MTAPIDTMVDAHETEFELWGVMTSDAQIWEVHRGSELKLACSCEETAVYEMQEARAYAVLRAALLALAEAPPTEWAMSCAERAYHDTWGSIQERRWETVRAAIRGMAYDGQDGPCSSVVDLKKFAVVENANG